MILGMYAIKDRLDGFTSPIPFTSEEIAIRWFQTMLDTNVDMKNNTADFTLWYMGEFNKDTGEMTSDPREVNL